VILWEAFAPAFATALIATLKVFAVGAAGFILTRSNRLTEDGLQTIGQLVGLLTLPCLIFYRFATFDPATMPDWWKYALIGCAITIFGLVLGKLTALRHGGNDEVTLLIGFQNAGFFVLPMLQALLPESQYIRASLLLFMLLIPFNASLWMACSWFLLGQRNFTWNLIVTPPAVATVGSLLVFGLLHDWVHQFDHTLTMQVLFGDARQEGSVGAIQQIGDLTVPLATLTMGGSIAAQVRGRVECKRAAVEVALMRLVVVPLLGYGILHAWIGRGDYVVWLLLMLQFASPPAMALPVFARQHGHAMRIIPAACLLCYILCLVTVPFFVALVPK